MLFRERLTIFTKIILCALYIVLPILKSNQFLPKTNYFRSLKSSFKNCYHFRCLVCFLQRICPLVMILNISCFFFQNKYKYFFKNRINFRAYLTNSCSSKQTWLENSRSLRCRHFFHDYVIASKLNENGFLESYSIAWKRQNIVNITEIWRNYTRKRFGDYFAAQQSSRSWSSRYWAWNL